jgi:tetratricopeptide (TPR) repeat protein
MRMANLRWLILAALCVSAAVMVDVHPSSAQQEAPGSPQVILLEAKRAFEALDYERALTTLDRVVSLLEPGTAVDPAQRAQLLEAYELRARARFGLNDLDGARADFKSLLTRDPGRTLTGQVSPNVVALFSEIKRTLVGALRLVVAPADADVQIDGAPAPRGNIPLPMVAGPHRITASQPGFRPASESFNVPPDAVFDLTVTLERVSATISLLTVPSDIEVTVDGVVRGVTAQGPPPADYEEAVRSLGVQPSSVSRPFLLADVATGIHVIEFKKDCYVRTTQRFEVQKPADYRLPPVSLQKAVGAVRVEGSSGNVFVDGQSRGPAPLTLDNICEGPHVVELRTSAGRDVKRFDVKTGDKLGFRAEPRPAVAVLAATGLPEGLRGGPDLRLALERLFQNARTISVFAPPGEQVDQTLAREMLAPGWLSFDTARRPIGEAAANITPTARQELAGRLARGLDVQGVAAVTVVSKEDRSDLFVTILAANSGEPETVRIKLDDRESVSLALAKLDARPALFRPSAAMQTADVLDVTGAVVVGVDAGGPAARAGLAVGDVITEVNGQPVADASRLGALIGSAKPDDQVAVIARDRLGAAKRAELRLVAVPQLIAMIDETLLFNKLLLDFRSQLQAPINPLEESVSRLNLSVALMRLGNWNDARVELEKVRLPDGPGVANGTVQYLLGLCREALGQPAEAEAAWRAAAAAQDALLTSEGPAIKDLAEKKLAELALRGRRPAGLQ